MVEIKTNEGDDYNELILVTIGISSPTLTHTTILDSGADVNVLSAEAYQHLAEHKLLLPFVVLQTQHSTA